jgi:hypothetical protein
MYVNTIDFIDIATGWTEQRAVWEKVKQVSWNRSSKSKTPSRFLSLDSIVTMEASSSTITSKDTLPKENNPSSSPEAEPIIKTTMLTSNRKTGHTSGNGSAMTA